LVVDVTWSKFNPYIQLLPNLRMFKKRPSAFIVNVSIVVKLPCLSVHVWLFLHISLMLNWQRIYVCNIMCKNMQNTFDLHGFKILIYFLDSMKFMKFSKFRRYISMKFSRDKISGNFPSLL